MPNFLNCLSLQHNIEIPAMIELAPITFNPYLRTVIWGGKKICKFKGIPSVDSKIGESWEISAIPQHESVVASGRYKGMTINQLVDAFGVELLGEKVIHKYGRRFPLLVKLIDAADNLSVQVHPDSELAMRRHGMQGKTEMWYVIAAKEGAKIFAGLTERMTPEEYVERVAAGTFAEAVAAHNSSAGDAYFLPPGRVHAIGAGNFIAEIQESSDITYRIFDYNRRDTNGQMRELHTDLAKDAIDFAVQDEFKLPPIPSDINDCIIVDCNSFTTRRVKVDGPSSLRLSDGSFTVVLCVEGDITLNYPEGSMALKEGHTVLLPAAMTGVTVDGKAILLVSSC